MVVLSWSTFCFTRILSRASRSSPWAYSIAALSANFTSWSNRATSTLSCASICFMFCSLMRKSPLSLSFSFCLSWRFNSSKKISFYLFMNLVIDSGGPDSLCSPSRKFLSDSSSPANFPALIGA